TGATGGAGDMGVTGATGGAGDTGVTGATGGAPDTGGATGGAAAAGAGPTGGGGDTTMTAGGGDGGVPSGFEASSSAAATAGPDPEIASAVAAVSAPRISMDIDTLVAFGTRNSCANNTPSGNAFSSARDWVEAQFSAIEGLAVSLDNF